MRPTWVRPVDDGAESPAIASLPDASRAFGLDLDRLPLSLRLLACQVLDGIADGRYPEDALAPIRDRAGTVPFLPARVLHQDYTGTAALADLAALRDAVAERGGDPRIVNPVVRTDFVVDHSLRVDTAGHPDAARENLAIELQRNAERYEFLAWAAGAFDNLTVIPPGVGIVHQINLERLADVVALRQGRLRLDSVLGTDSHTTMVNSLGVLGWGVGGVEAEAAMLGAALPVTLPSTVLVRLTGALAGSATAMDVALNLTALLRRHAPVGAFVEFTGPGVATLSLPDRATIANMAPEYGVTMALFPIDNHTLTFLESTGRRPAHVQMIEAVAKHQGLWADDLGDVGGDVTLTLDLATIQPVMSGPTLPQQVRSLNHVPAATKLATAARSAAGPATRPAPPRELHDGAVAIAAITSCTNTSNPSALIAAGLVAQRAVELGLRPPEWVKTSFTPGSPAVPRYLRRLGLLEPLEELGFHVAGFGCATCAGGSGALVGSAASDTTKQLAAVLSGNRNFAGRIHPRCDLTFLASPALVVAYALTGTVTAALDALEIRSSGARTVTFVDLLPTRREVDLLSRGALRPIEVRASYGDLIERSPSWGASAVNAPSSRFSWAPASTWLRRPPFADVSAAVTPIDDAAVLGWFGDDVTTDHISPAGSIPVDSPAGQWLAERGVSSEDAGTYGARRANHEVMVRGTFANPHLTNFLCPSEPGGKTVNSRTGAIGDLYDAALDYRRSETPSVVVAGHRYGAGSSRDWAAKGTSLLGVRAVLAQSFERIHRANLAWFGVLPVELAGAVEIDPTCRVTIAIPELAPGAPVTVTFSSASGSSKVHGTIRLDNRDEVQAHLAGGLLPLTLRRLLDNETT